MDSGVAIGPTTSIGDNVTLGANSVVENCILMDDVRVGPGSILRNCIVAEGATVGPRFTALAGPCDFHAEDGPCGTSGASSEVMRSSAAT